MIVDLRVRPPYAGYLDTHMYRDRERTAKMSRAQGCDPPAALAEARWDLFLEELGTSGIDVAVVPGRRAGPAFGDVPNEDVARMAREAGGKIVGFAAVKEGDPSAPDELEFGVRELGLAGLALDPGFADMPRYADDPALQPLYERCLRLQVPAMITISGNAGPDITYGDPVRIDRVAASYPELQIIVAHGGWPWIPAMLGVAFRRPNVWISPDMYVVNMPGARDFVDAANGFLRDRLLFGSSYPFLPFAGALEGYRAHPFRGDVLAAVLGGNAARLLGLD
jgi:uncharacterized protein